MPWNQFDHHKFQHTVQKNEKKAWSGLRIVNRSLIQRLHISDIDISLLKFKNWFKKLLNFPPKESKMVFDPDDFSRTDKTWINDYPRVTEA